MPTMARVLDLCCVHVFLQLVQRFRKQGRDRLACLLGERDKQVFLFRRQVKRVRFHTLTIPKAPRICKELIQYSLADRGCKQPCGTPSPA